MAKLDSLVVLPHQADTNAGMLFIILWILGDEEKFVNCYTDHLMGQTICVWQSEFEVVVLIGIFQHGANLWLNNHLSQIK